MPRIALGTRSITAAALTCLLERLDPDPDRAAHEYERLRTTLVRFFDWRGAWPPDECADETIDRLSRKLEDGTAVDDVRLYARGIARMLLHERSRAPVFTPLDDEQALPAVPVVVADESERRRACFDRCLDALPVESRTLVLEYYEGDCRTKIANRRRMASAAGVSDNALRSRVQRVRDRLEHCVVRCVSAADGDL